MEDNLTYHPIAPVLQGAIGAGKNIYKFRATIRNQKHLSSFFFNGYVIAKDKKAAREIVGDELALDLDAGELSLQEVNGQYFFMVSQYCVGDGSLLDDKRVHASGGKGASCFGNLHVGLNSVVGPKEEAVDPEFFSTTYQKG